MECCAPLLCPFCGGGFSLPPKGQDPERRRASSCGCGAEFSLEEPFDGVLEAEASLPAGRETKVVDHVDHWMQAGEEAAPYNRAVALFSRERR